MLFLASTVLVLSGHKTLILKSKCIVLRYNIGLYLNENLSTPMLF